MAFDLDPSYKQVPERIADFKAKHPEGCLRPANPERPFWFEEVAGQMFVCYVAAAYRTPDDPTPGIGSAWEPVPGKTPYTRLSELQNAETSAWGRAIVAVLASESKAVASAEDVRNRQADAWENAQPAMSTCPACGFQTPAADKEPMRAHLVAEHGFIRQEDGTVIAPKIEGEEGKALDRGEHGPSEVGTSSPSSAAEGGADSSTAPPPDPTRPFSEDDLEGRARRLQEKAAEKRPEDVKRKAAADA